MGYGGGFFGSTTSRGKTYNSFFSTDSRQSSDYNSSENGRFGEEGFSGFNLKEEENKSKSSNGDALIHAMWIIAITAAIISILYVIIADGIESFWSGFWGIFGL